MSSSYNKLLITPYKHGSKGAKALKEALGCKFTRRENTQVKPNTTTHIVNWGCSRMQPALTGCNVLNHPDAVALASNKREFFNSMPPDIVPPFTTSQEEASKWVEEGSTVFCRTLLKASGGRGIVLAKQPEELVEAPLYTKWVRPSQEYRVHIFQECLLDIQRKARKRDVPDEEVNWKIRNLAGGFIFARNEEFEEELVNKLRKVAVQAVEGCGLDFGAA